MNMQASNLYLYGKMALMSGSYVVTPRHKCLAASPKGFYLFLHSHISPLLPQF